MPEPAAHRFVTVGEMQVEELPWGPHEWLCRPGLTEAEKLLLVRVRMPPGEGHAFHRRPEMEEIILRGLRPSRAVGRSVVTPASSPDFADTRERDLVLVDVRNVLDELYHTTGFPDPSGSGAGYIYPRAGRTVGVGVTLDW